MARTGHPDRELWEALKTLLGITDKKVTSFELRMAVDEVATVKLTRLVDIDGEIKPVPQMYRLEPLGTMGLLEQVAKDRPCKADLTRDEMHRRSDQMIDDLLKPEPPQ